MRRNRGQIGWRRACGVMLATALLLADAGNRPLAGAGQPRAGEVIKGEVIKGEFAGSTVYPGTWREYWVYIPHGLDRTKPAPVMVFQDGLQYNAPAVFDELMAKKALPP